MAEKYTLFHVEGGLGKNVAATAVAQCIKNNHQNRKLIVVCSYPEVFMHNPCVHEVYRIGNHPYFYDKYIAGKDTLIFKHEPYFTHDHIYKKKSLIENWCEMYGLKYNKEMPELFISQRIRDLIKNKYARQKPIMIIHSNGGLFQGQPTPYSWCRDMPRNLVQQVADVYANKYHIYQVCRHEANIVNGVEAILEPMSNLELFSILLLSKKRLLIDSCLQHAAVALPNLPSTVLWIGSPKDVFGYDMHTNIQANPPKNPAKLIDSYLFDYNFNGVIHEYPYMEGEEMFDKEEIIKSLE